MSPRWSDCPASAPYTARAAIAFGMLVGAADTNAPGRCLPGRRASARAPGGVLPVADASVPRFRAADWTHALMDVGATVCRGIQAGLPALSGVALLPPRRDRRIHGGGAGHGLPGTGVRRRRGGLRGRILDVLRDGIAGSMSAYRSVSTSVPRSRLRWRTLRRTGSSSAPPTGASRVRCRSRPPPRRGRLGRRCRLAPRPEPPQRLDLPRRAAAARRRPDAVRARPARPRLLGLDGRATADDG